jgi:hypothetical protein
MDEAVAGLPQPVPPNPGVHSFLPVSDHKPVHPAARISDERAAFMLKRLFCPYFVIILSVLAAGPAVLSVPAAADTGPWFMERPSQSDLNLTNINGSLPNGSLPAVVTPAATPITLLHLELNQTSLPGERYMAFGPSVIDIAVPPAILVLLGIVAGGGAAAWYLLGKEGRNG